MRKLLLPVLAGVTMLPSALHAQQRVPLFEVFTSSTCGPCNPGNAVYENVISTKPAADFVSIKYQQNFPSTGDPYATLESVNRRSSYYAITSIPRMEIDGAWNQNAQSFTDALYTQYKAIPAEYKISGTYSVKNKVVTVKVKYSPIVASAIGAGAKLYVAILEGQTIKNVKTNGESKFYNVMKKMLPTETGTSLPASAVNKADSMSFTFTFAGAYRLPTNGRDTSYIKHASEHSVEDFANLKVVAWVQNPTDKHVYQAGNLTKVNPAAIGDVPGTVGAMSVYPNPASDKVSIDFEMKESDEVTYSVINNAGAVVATQTAKLNAGKTQMTIDTKNLANGLYNVVVLDSKHNSFGQRLVISH